MDTQEKIVCRLCLKVCDSFKAIEEDLKDALDMVLKRIDLTLIQEPMICTYCAAMLIKCSQFKTTCLITRDCVLPFIDNKNNDVQLNLKEVYHSLSEDGVGLSESQVICGFCMSPVKSCSAIFFDVEWGDVILQKMIEECLPELDFSIIKKPVICPPCRDSLENCFCFVTNCSIIEEKIKKYRESKNINGEGQIELSGILEFMTGDVTVKVEKKDADEGMSGNEDGVLTVEPMLVHVNGIVKVKLELESESCTEMDDDVTTKNVLAYKRDIKIEETFRDESKLKEEIVDVQDELIEEIDIKTKECDFNRCENEVSPQLEVITGLRVKQICLTPDLEKELSKSCITENTNKGNNPSNIMYKSECPYQMNDKNYLKEHLRKDTSEVTVNKCDYCSYQTKRKYHLKEHLLKHKDPSEVTMYKCSLCLFQTKLKNSLKRHMLTHGDPSDVYKCDYCPYQTKHKYHLKEHLLKHKDPSEVTMYKCGLCSYQTKLKNSLKRHMLVHKDPSEVTIYKCNLCAFQTKFKKSLNIHKWTHMSPSEVTMYKCDSCPYQTKHKCHYKEHLLKHKDPLEVPMYKCGLCLFQTRLKNTLNRHMLTHKDPSEVEIYKCSLCAFQTKFKKSLNRHMLTHKDPSEVTMYKCDSCLYQTKHKSNLTDHLLKHKDPSKVTMYKCDSCSFQTKYKNYIKEHLLRHKKPSEVAMYKCSLCEFHTKLKNGLKQHNTRKHDCSVFV